jgi:hypothetical protein
VGVAAEVERLVRSVTALPAKAHEARARRDMEAASMWRRCALLLPAALSILASPAWPGTLYQVGPDRSYETLQDVEDLLEPGDVVEVDGNETYPGGVWFQEHGTEAEPITIRGIRIDGKRPHLDGGNNTVELQGDWYLFEGFEVTGGASRCIYHHADHIVIRDVVVHDCPKQGILGADQDSGSLLLEHCEVYACGEGTQNHQIYMATDEVAHPGSVFRMQYCYVHDANGGNSVKSRAERNEIYYNWIEGAVYHELELIGPDPDGAPENWEEDTAREDSDVVGNVLWKSDADLGVFVTRVGGDGAGGTGESNGRYRFVNNTILTVSGSAVFRIFLGIESIEMHNNVIFRPTVGAPLVVRTAEASWVDGEKIAGSNNWVETGSSTVPTQWTGAITGADPGFADLGIGDLLPLAGSPLVGTANPSPATPEDFEISDPLFPPGYHPPLRTFQAVGDAQIRPVVGVLDIGAFEYADPVLFGDGFESGDPEAWSAKAPP